MTLTRVLLVCGVVTPVFFLAMDIVAGALVYPGYDFASQQVSELSAIGAPSRDFWMRMGYVHALLGFAFATGVWLAAEGRLGLRIAAALIALFTLTGFLWGNVAPMHMRGAEFSATDTMHILFVFPTIFSMLGFIGFGAAAFGTAFRIYSGITIAAMLAAGAIVGTQVPAIAAGEPTPWMGLVERVAVHGPLIWLAVFAVALMRSASPAPSRVRAAPGPAGAP